MCQSFIQFTIERTKEMTVLATNEFEKLGLTEFLGTETWKNICWVRYKTCYYPIRE